MIRQWLAVRVAVVLSIPVALFIGCGDDGGGGGGGPAFGDFLNMDSLGTSAGQADVTLGANVYVLVPAEGISEDEAAGTVTLAAPANPYAVGHYIIGDGATARFAKKITSVTTSGTDLVLGVTDAKVQEFIDSGTISANVTPDWSSGGASPKRASAKGLGQEDVTSDGSIVLDNLSVFDFKITTDGTIDWASSSVMGDPVASNSGVVKMADVSSCAGGYLRATVTQGTLRVVPTTTFDYQIAAGDLSATGSMDVHVLYSVSVQVEASGQCQLELERTLLPALSFPVTLPTTPPVYLDVELEVPAGFKLNANASGTALMEYRSEYAIAVDMSYTTAGGFSASKQWDKVWDQQNVDWGVNGFVVGELYLEPTVKVLLYGVGGPFIYLRPYIRAELYYPWQNDQDELFIGIGGGVGLELKMFLWNVSVKSDNLFDIYHSWDLMGPSGGSDLNLAPAANAQAVVVPTTGTEIRLTGSDPDGDLLSFVIDTAPLHGSLGLLNSSTGRVFYTPYAGYLGSDSFTFKACDGEQFSNTATVGITVVGNTEPNASFAYSVTGRTVDVDASGSSDAEDSAANLQVRWDWTNDGSWDTTWTNAKTTSHTYGTGGTYVVRLQVRDTDGMTDTIAHAVDVQNSPPSGSLISPSNGTPVRDTTPTFNWTRADPDGDTVTAYLYISTDTTPFTSPDVITGRNVGTGTSYPLPPGDALSLGVYSWGIRLNDGYGGVTDVPASGPGWVFEIIDNSPPSGSLSSPSNGASITDTTPTFNWTRADPDGDTVTAYLYISTDTTPFTSPDVITGRNVGTGTSYPLPPGDALSLGVHSWGIRLNDGYGGVTDVPASGPGWVFDVSNSPPTGSLSLPSNGASTTDRTPTFTWTRSDPDGDTVTAYLYISTDSTPFTSPNILDGRNVGTGTSYPLPSGDQLGYTVYSWGIRLDDGNGGTTYVPASGPGRVFEVVNVAPTGSLTSPSNGSSTTDTTPTFLWSRSDGNGDTVWAYLYVSTDATPFTSADVVAGINVGTGTSWDLSSFSPGIYCWGIRLRDAAGAETYVPASGPGWVFEVQ